MGLKYIETGIIHKEHKNCNRNNTICIYSPQYYCPSVSFPIIRPFAIRVNFPSRKQLVKKPFPEPLLYLQNCMNGSGYPDSKVVRTGKFWIKIPQKPPQINRVLGAALREVADAASLFLFPDSYKATSVLVNSLFYYVTVVVYDLLGHTLYSAFYSLPYIGIVEIPTAHFPSAIFILQLITDRNMISKKFHVDR